MKTWSTSIRAFVFFTILTGAVYPLLVTTVGKTLFPAQADGSLIYRSGQLVGSELLGQNFEKPEFFHGRPQETTNLSPKSDKLLKTVADREKNGDVAERRYGSVSSLDPDISLEAALAQVDRVAYARRLEPKLIDILVHQNVTESDFGFLGEARINVLKLNLKVEELK